MYKVVITRKASLDLQKIPKNYSRIILEKIENVAKNPYLTNNNVKKLQGEEAYRLRVGDYRVIYELDDYIRIMEVINIKPRGDAYK